MAEKRVAIEVDGPSHFVGASQRPTGATLLKRRQLHALGWAVISVPYFEWDPLRGPEQQQDYLRKRLRAAGIGGAGWQRHLVGTPPTRPVAWGCDATERRWWHAEEASGRVAYSM